LFDYWRRGGLALFWVGLGLVGWVVGVLALFGLACLTYRASTSMRVRQACLLWLAINQTPPLLLRVLP